jgi:BASS family bile acid:Na+ symporter
MTLANIVSLGLTVSLFVLVLVLGLKAKLDNVTFLFRNPGLLLRSILAMNVVVLAIVVLASVLLDLEPAIKIALVTLAVSPVPPLLPGKQISAGGTPDYAVGLLVAAAVVAIVLVPLSIELMEYAFPLSLYIAPGKVASIVMLSIFAPLIMGLIVSRLWPDLAARIASPLSTVATVLLLVALIPVFIRAWPDFARLFGNGVVLSRVVFSAVGLAIGHALGGPDPDDRTVLALATATRHPGIAIAIASLNFPDQPGVMALVVYHLVIGGIVSAPYIRWRKKTKLNYP